MCGAFSARLHHTGHIVTREQGLWASVEVQPATSCVMTGGPTSASQWPRIDIQLGELANIYDCSPYNVLESVVVVNKVAMARICVHDHP